MVVSLFAIVWKRSSDSISFLASVMVSNGLEFCVLKISISFSSGTRTGISDDPYGSQTSTKSRKHLPEVRFDTECSCAG